MMWMRGQRAPELFVLLFVGSLLLCSVYLYLFPAQLESLPSLSGRGIPHLSLNRTREALLAAHHIYTTKVRSFAPTTTTTRRTKRRNIWLALMAILLDLGWDQHSWPVRCCAVPTRVCDSRLRPAPVAGYANS
jgi:hypothetical protein